MKGYNGDKLKRARIASEVSVKEISEYLISNGFKASSNTIYSWENNNSQPTPDALLYMCEKYKVSDPMSFFGYGESDAMTLFPPPNLTPNETKIIQAYRSQPEMRPAVARLLGIALEEGKIHTNVRKPYLSDNEIDAEVESYRQQLTDEKTAVETLQASRGAKGA